MSSVAAPHPEPGQYVQWCTKNFRMGGVEVLQAPRGISLSPPFPTVGGCGEGKFFAFVFRNRKFFAFLLKMPQFDAF